MKKTTLILGLALLIFVSAGFECSMTTANLSDIKFAKDKEGKQPASSFDTGKEIYAMVDATGLPSGKHKLAWKVTYDNVAGKTKGDKVGEQSMDLTSSSTVWTTFTTPLPGDYKVEATLTDEAGKTIATKSGTAKVTGTAPAAPAASTDDKKDDDSDDK
ncbi:MAG: hypothetical protein KA831_05295 [Pyrinomonadaceae bacterium]|nr:hypothetical protein [Pyrinomonadaceae bacterium]